MSILFYVVIIIILVFLSSWQALNFHFLRDDWSRLWMAFYRPDLRFHLTGLPDHPGTAIEQFILGPIFGFNPFLWQLEGLGLKICASLVVALIMWTLTKSKILSFWAGVLFATSMLGIESFTWVSAHTAALIICFFGIGFYFWTESLNRGNWYVYTLGLMLSLISFLISPARGISIPILLSFWDLLTLFRQPTKKVIRLIFVRNTILYLVIGSFIFIFFRGGSGNLTSRPIEELTNILINPYTLRTYLSSIGNLILGWIIPRPDIASYSNPTFLSIFAANILVISILVSFALFIEKRTKNLQIIFFLLAFIFLAYLPNWWFYSYVIAGASHRYLTLSSVAVTCLITFFVGTFNVKFRKSIFIALLILNIFLTNKLLSSQLPYRSFETVDKIWNTIDRQVDRGENKKVFLYSGDHPYILMLLNWSSTIPFAIKRRILDPKEFPILVYDLNMLKKLICGEKVNISSLDGGFVNTKPIPLTSIYVWGIDNKNEVVNLSKDFRKNINTQVKCLSD